MTARRAIARRLAIAALASTAVSAVALANPSRATAAYTGYIFCFNPGTGYPVTSPSNICSSHTYFLTQDPNWRTPGYNQREFVHVYFNSWGQPPTYSCAHPGVRYQKQDGEWRPETHETRCALGGVGLSVRRDIPISAAAAATFRVAYSGTGNGCAAADQSYGCGNALDYAYGKTTVPW